jgi:hypothetical protein
VVAFILFTTGLMGLLGLCILIHAFSFGGVGFFRIKYFIWLLLNIRLHCFKVSRIVFVSLFIGFLWVCFMSFSIRKLCTLLF